MIALQVILLTYLIIGTLFSIFAPDDSIEDNGQQIMMGIGKTILWPLYLLQLINMKSGQKDHIKE